MVGKFERQKAEILDYIRSNVNNPYLTQQRVADYTKIHKAIVSRAIKVLIKESKVGIIKVGNNNVLIAIVRDKEDYSDIDGNT